MSSVSSRKVFLFGPRFPFFGCWPSALAAGASSMRAVRGGGLIDVNATMCRICTKISRGSVEIGSGSSGSAGMKARVARASSFDIGPNFGTGGCDVGTSLALGPSLWKGFEAIDRTSESNKKAVLDG